MKTEMVNLAGGRIRYRDSGGEGIPVLFSSGIGQSLEFWQHQFDALNGSCRLIAWDYPGHGHSDIGHTKFHVDTLPDVALQLLDHLRVDAALFVGNSLGGAVSVRAYRQAPDRVLGLVLAAPALCGPDVCLPFRLMTLPFVGSIMTKASEENVDIQIRSVFHPSAAISPELREAIHRNTFKPGADATFLSFTKDTLKLRGVRDQVWNESRRILQQAQCPVLFIHGRDDVVLPYQQTVDLSLETPGSMIELYNECGHAPQVEKPDGFNRHLLEFKEIVTKSRPALMQSA